MKFRSNLFSLSKVIESSSWFSHIHSTLTVCKMKNKTSFEIRAYHKGRIGLTVSVSQIYSELCQIHGTSVVSKRSIFRWHKKFKCGKTDLKDEHRPSHPRKAATKANVAAVADMVKQDARFTVKEIADSAGVSSGTVHKILTRELKRWICLFVLRFYGPVNPMGSCQAQSVYLTTCLLGRLSPLSG